MYRIAMVLTFLAMLGTVNAQNSLRAKVIDEHDRPLPGAIVQVQESFLITSSDQEGNFTLKLDDRDEAEIIIRFIGFETQRLLLKLPYSELLIIRMESSPILTQEAVVEATRAGASSPIAHNEVSAEDIEKLNNGQDLPFLLRFTPSVVVTSDAGAGIGYTGMRIRGSDASRINVTINGIPLNDPESQAVYWVNVPDLSSSLNSVQIQRGVGTSVNGAGAFGGSINLSTSAIHPEAFGQISNTYGSFNTWKNSVEFGSGLLNDHWAFEGRLSQILSDGYIDRASAELRSYYLSGAYYSKNTTIKAIAFAGVEETYQSWYGTPQSRVENDEEGMLTHALNNGYDAEQFNNLINSGRTFNYYLYENEVDNYSQDNYQLHISHRLNQYLEFNVSGHYTWGRGYFEQYRKDDDLSDYGLNPIQIQSGLIWSNAFDDDGNPYNANWGQDIDLENVELSQELVLDGNGDPILDAQGNTLLSANAAVTGSDVVRRRWLDNEFYGATWSLNYRKDALSAVFGGAVNRYDGDHFGELIWMRNAATSEPGDYFYLNNGLKDDASAFVRVNYRLKDKIDLFADLQVRQVKYSTTGIDIDQRDISLEDKMSFFNPKLGVNYQINQANRVYASYSIANREPTRNDYIDSPSLKGPSPENMQDIEIGYQRRSSKYYWGVNFYNMDYTDQLVLSGELNDVGSPVRTNVASSYRRGAEFEFGWNVLKNLQFYANFTYSQNKIEAYDEVLYNYLNSGDIDIQTSNFTNTDISFSPEIISSGMLTYKFMKRKKSEMEVAWMVQYVGEQFLDNTSNPDRALDAYLVNDARLTYNFKSNNLKGLSLNLLVNNVLSEEYSSNGYTYSYAYEGFGVTENFYYPQATRNFLLSLNLKF